MSSTVLRAPAEDIRDDAPNVSWARAWYAAFCDPESPRADRLPVARVRELIAGPAPSGQDSPDLPALLRQAAQWSTEEAAVFRQLAAGARQDTVRARAAQRLALGCAPLALLSGAWLQWLSSMAESDDPGALAVLSLYASDVGVGHPRSSRGHACLAPAPEPARGGARGAGRPDRPGSENRAGVLRPARAAARHEQAT
ncbi:hypothetical protein [Streptomyces broussonetiae]|uniref:hypothetical protein n=1 Tax=Streptomyces broussonetiae TaxID=2686304 RepID=UPI0035DDFAE1